MVNFIKKKKDQTEILKLCSLAILCAQNALVSKMDFHVVFITEFAQLKNSKITFYYSI